VDISDSGSPDSITAKLTGSDKPPGPEPKVRALAIGASQDPSAAAKQKAAEAAVDLREVRYIPRRFAGVRGGDPLPDVIDDVVTVKEWMESSGPVEVNRFVGRDDTNSLTRKAFLAKVERLLAQPGELFILYYAGHGTDGTQAEHDAAPGAFCMQKDGYVTLDDLVNLWAGAQVTARRGQRFVIIADSCFSGALVGRLKQMHRERRREGLPNLNMAVQSACGTHETSTGGLFTRPFVEKQTGERSKFDWKGAIPHKSVCSCRSFFKDGCSSCAMLHEEFGFPRHIGDVQHPDFFTTWGEDTINIGGFTLRFYRRVM
jgi:hypothetical protein